MLGIKVVTRGSRVTREFVKVSADCWDCVSEAERVAVDWVAEEEDDCCDSDCALTPTTPWSDSARSDTKKAAMVGIVDGTRESERWVWRGDCFCCASDPGW